MARYSDAESVREEHLEILGPKLGPVYHELYNECAWLHIKWNQYVELYGAKPERIDLLNRSASLFFRVVQDALLEDTLLNLARLTDPPKSAGKNNLTVQRLPALITDAEFRIEIQNLVDVAIDATAFARDWRNRHIAHKDLALALSEGAEPLAPASRKHVKDALLAVSRILQRINEFYFKSDLYFGPIAEPYGALALLYVIRDGVEAEERRQQRLRSGKLELEDIEPSREV
jgi:hypothetical protein